LLLMFKLAGSAGLSRPRRQISKLPARPGGCPPSRAVAASELACAFLSDATRRIRTPDIAHAQSGAALCKTQRPHRSAASAKAKPEYAIEKLVAIK
jgi:hypothetical protein